MSKNRTARKLDQLDRIENKLKYLASDEVRQLDQIIAEEEANKPDEDQDQALLLLKQKEVLSMMKSEER